MNRQQYWSQIKELASELKVEINVKWPRLSNQQAEDEYRRLKNIKINREAEEKMNEEIEEAREIGKDFFDEPEVGKEVSTDDGIDFFNARVLRAFLNNIRQYDDFYLLLKVNDGVRLVNDDKFDQIVENLNSYVDDKSILDNFGSDMPTEYDPNVVDFIGFTWEKKERKKKEGAYFPYYNNLQKVDLSRYQIYRNKKESDYSLNCLEYTIKTAGIVNENDFNRVKLMIRSRTIPKKDLKVIAAELNIQINLKYYKQAGLKTETIKYGNSTKQINIGLLAGHYFLNEDTKYTRFSIINYEKISNYSDFNRIYSQERLKNGNTKYKRADRYITSFELIKILLLEPAKYLTPITIENSNINNSFKLNEDYVLTDDVICKELVYNEPKLYLADYDFIYFDVETTTNGHIHKPYMICSESRDGKAKHRFTGKYCIQSWLKTIKNNSVCYAHNLRYDFQFVLPFVTCTSITKSGNRVKTAKCRYGKYTLIFKDTCSMITEKLKEFPTMFGLEDEKEIIPYELYTEASVLTDKLPIDSAKPYLSDEDFEKFKENIENLRIGTSDGMFYHLRYAAYYCRRDVTVLKQGYEKFREWMQEITDIDIDYCVSLPQLAHKFGLKSGVYDGCYTLSGVARDFIQRSVVGGRCMTRNNEKFITECRVEDLDGVSLYPSAMYRIPGFLMGTPKLYREGVDLSTVDGYFLEIDVKDVKINRAFPLISRKNEEGIRMFDNNIRGKIIVDKFTLEDLIEFQQIDYEIVRGYYFDEGRNSKINQFIKNLFEERLKKKKEGNKIQIVYKLLMNAFYGKTILKPIEHEYRFVRSAEKLRKTISYNFNHIEEYVEIGKGYTEVGKEYYMIKQKKPIIDHYNSCHIGSEILGISKRIMNEVFTLAEDNNIDIYYQDTDSMHLRNDDGQLDRLSELYYAKYNRVLQGSALGQFHCDFEVEGATISPYAVKSIFLGKKTYYDKVCAGDFTADVYRMKGIPGSLITNPEQTYTDLYNGAEYIYNLATVCKFTCNKNFTTSNTNIFDRVVCFSDETKQLRKERQKEIKREERYIKKVYKSAGLH
jgi:hypothetical protein